MFSWVKLLRVDNSSDVPMYWQLINQNVCTYAAFVKARWSLSERIIVWLTGTVLDTYVLLTTVSFWISCNSPLSILVKLNVIDA